MTTKRLRLTGLPAGAAALLAGATPVSASAAEPPLNYGSCVSYEAMFGDSVREFTDFFGPATIVGEMVNLPPGSDLLGRRLAARNYPRSVRGSPR